MAKTGLAAEIVLGEVILAAIDPHLKERKDVLRGFSSSTAAPEPNIPEILRWGTRIQQE